MTNKTLVYILNYWSMKCRGYANFNLNMIIVMLAVTATFLIVISTISQSRS